MDFPQPLGPMIGQRLARGDLEVDVVDGAHQPLAAAVLLAQPSGTHDGRARTVLVH